ncbi:hypothetical protein [Nocardia brasiliensis]|uniref:hypothetical protein n=1 Tax=Nocardia brasiliensis TaxID=37326 RepID=UPI002458D979|nr:hypothetical protein [Nocardia brasiliensis]
MAATLGCRTVLARTAPPYLDPAFYAPDPGKVAAAQSGEILAARQVHLASAFPGRDTRVALWGYSSGAIPAGHAADRYIDRHLNQLGKGLRLVHENQCVASQFAAFPFVKGLFDTPDMRTAPELQPDLEHGIAAFSGTAGAGMWLNPRLNGIPAPSGCNSRDVLSAIADPGAIATFANAIGQNLASALGMPV